MRLTAPPHLDTRTLPLWPPLLATRGPGARSEGHAHHAMHLVVTLKGTLAVQVEGGPAQRAAGVLTAPDVPHALDARGTEILLVFLDPQGEAGASLLPTLPGPVRLLTRAEADAVARDADPLSLMQEGGAAWTRALVETLGAQPLPERAPPHPRVRKLLRLLRELPPEADTSLEALAAQVGLSSGRLMHAFTASIGLPLRPYLAWLRLQRAAAGIVGGMPLSEAAHAAGFSDGAHMSRTFRRMLGMAPSALQRPLLP
ncbi:AraC family transcriptional regulator [Aggregicoccus sp. 17bor-14]|uniref:AraC family transcriptional regulator n=1 Tax=Myxococcaceae TaxID=31 RepID=UPI00129CFEDC|nr:MULTISPECIES: helix-turn-helix transcriptional regulator [Myxococcaceae]MBF5041640.1 AraC family transcriptional regulator [Simulacricoccus sp. 17bor-14]MRI87424.1 AraC family transcriptional regulator [Aggregicoccus sp. 17bor-14]